MSRDNRKRLGTPVRADAGRVFREPLVSIPPIIGNESGMEWDGVCPRSQRTSVTKLKLAPKSLNSANHCSSTLPVASSFDICSSIIVLLLGNIRLGFLWFPTDSVKMRSRMFLVSYTSQRFDTGSHHFFVIFLARNKVSVNHMNPNESR